MSARFPDQADVLERLRTVDDPELPISIVDLGIVSAVEIDGATAITVFLVPTFIGCPALATIESRAEECLRTAYPGAVIRVAWRFDQGWSPERISEAGQKRLTEYGIQTPQPVGITCPFCGGQDVVRENPFGPALCKSTYYCNECRNPFEGMKLITLDVSLSS